MPSSNPSVLPILFALGAVSLVACGSNPGDSAESSSNAIVADQPATGINQAGWNILTAVHSQKVLDLPGGTRAEGAAVAQWEPNGGPNQQWKLSSPAPGEYEIYSTVSGQALGIKDGSLEDGAPVVQSVPPGISQLFYALDAGNGAVTFKNVVSGKCLDVQGASLDNGAPIIQYTCNGNENQQWRLTHVFGD